MINNGDNQKVVKSKWEKVFLSPCITNRINQENRACTCNLKITLEFGLVNKFSDNKFVMKNMISYRWKSICIIWEIEIATLFVSSSFFYFLKKKKSTNYFAYITYANLKIWKCILFIINFIFSCKIQVELFWNNNILKTFNK